ncbi:MAG: hypothetical protein LBL13_11410 [Bacteroidales bacterium]|jgi:hypothetical protein|nr:hypothetical protein [Bacteroidales bacterium]
MNTEKEEIAKVLAKKFNTSKIPTLGYIEMSKYLSSIGIRYFSIMMCLNLRDKFFNIEKRTIDGNVITVYSPKKEPIHFTKFIDLLDYYDDYKKRNKDKAKGSRNRLIVSAFKAIFKEKPAIPFAQFTGAFYSITKTELKNDELNDLLKRNAIAYKNGCYYLPQKSGEQLVGNDYQEPEFLTPKEKKAKKKASSKMHDSRIENNNVICDNYRIEFNQEKQLFHYDDGSHEENTFGWRTVEKGVRNPAYWIIFDMIRTLFNHKFSSVKDIQGLYVDFLNIIHHLPPDGNLTIEICVNFLKKNGYKGKVEKILKSEFEI